MKAIFLSVVASLLIAGCSCQGGFLGRIVQGASQLLEPVVNQNNGQDGYKFRYATDDQVREEEGSFVDGIWTVRGIVEWLSPDKKMKHIEMYMADDNGYKSQVMDEPFGRSGLSGGALASLAGYSTVEQTREESGAFENGIWMVKGTVTWIDPFGQQQAYSYIADDKGYRTQQSSTTVPPPNSNFFPAVLRGLSSGAIASLGG